jgi:hypothetical protein
MSPGFPPISFFGGRAGTWWSSGRPSVTARRRLPKPRRIPDPRHINQPGHKHHYAPENMSV